MPPALATYQQAASDIYEPLKSADINSATAAEKATVANLEASKGQISTDYQSAVDKLTQSVQDQSSQIAQLYSERLGGNFSGLQGNDMGQMFARANEQQSIIEQTRANKLSAITTGETNAANTLLSDIASIGSKYQSEEVNYAQSSYGSAMKDYNDTQYKNAELGLRYASLAASQSSKSQAQYKVTGKSAYSSTGGSAGTGGNVTSTSNGYNFTGPNGKPINMAEYISGAGMGGQDIVDLLQNGSSYDRNIASKLAKANPQNDDQLVSLIKKYDTGHYYGF